MARHFSFFDYDGGANPRGFDVDSQISGDPLGVRACEEMNARQREDAADILDAAGNFGRAFLREKTGDRYRIWEIRSTGEGVDGLVSGASSGSASFEVSLFVEGQIPLTSDEGR